MAEQNDSLHIVLELLDSSQGHALQTWRFESQSLVCIGRAEESDVAIVDPRVSRLHVELRFGPSGWQLISKGRNGVLVNGLPVTEHALSDRSTFQLGSSGPRIRFRENHEPANNMATIEGYDESLLDILQIDEDKKDEEVRQITSGALFQNLKQKAKELRDRHAGDALDSETMRD